MDELFVFRGKIWGETKFGLEMLMVLFFLSFLFIIPLPSPSPATTAKKTTETSSSPPPRGWCAADLRCYINVLLYPSFHPSKFILPFASLLSLFSLFLCILRATKASTSPSAAAATVTAPPRTRTTPSPTSWPRGRRQPQVSSGASARPSPPWDWAPSKCSPRSCPPPPLEELRPPGKDWVIG